ncbi:aldo/keto reductase [Oharaeibacter diazotrophicus]|uniref:D-threo-aldose 1-dehydrogenase n=1 Tax=Oharaeibacter diazotrophicus TaxID=1920512 RepID=A0A4R6RCD5_9HYPH|nr:aldo/keto reductase [Oharaeibacter diazotrophicus]TDP83336.1 D-threo-aldose 1-dehydrogenase [Oharaeibacter diazotrophicus]BBE72169.1 pyridoxal 4-dehydrogenase [Pleomorphomonas sp. SM30]GLS78935.1 oxidoreductase [Oharaeibacter diazotrophicus]
MDFARRPLGRSGLGVTAYGFGGAPLGNLFRTVPRADAEALLEAVWAAGFRFFDTAPFYGFGLSERRLGDVLRDKPRGDFVLSTKVGRVLKPNPGDHPARADYVDALPFEPVYDYSYDGVMRSFEHSLQRLGLDRVDVLLMHDIGRVTHGDAHEETFRIAMDGGARAMDELRRSGAVSAIGLGVNEWQVCEAAMDHLDWDCFLLAGRYTLLEQEALASFLPRCEKVGASIVVGGAFNSGILATGPVPGARYNYAPAPAEILERVGRIEAVCRRHGVALPAAALAFPLTHPAVACVIPGMASPRELDANLALLAAAIPSALWADLKAEGLMRPDAPTP